MWRGNNARLAKLAALCLGLLGIGPAALGAQPAGAQQFIGVGNPRRREALELPLTRALNGELSVKEALDQVAADWEKITDELGRDQQLALYRASMGLPPEPNRPRHLSL